MIKNRFFSLVYIFLVVNSLSGYAQKTAFTTTDAIKVKSLSSQTLSDNGKYLAGIIQDGGSRFGVDHFRFRDPSYINLFLGELVILDTEEGESLRPYAQAARVSSLAWAPNNQDLAFIEQKGNKLSLMIYNVERKKVREVSIAGNPLLKDATPVWTPDSKSLLVQTRNPEWLGKSMELYNEATKGPIVVYDGSKPFLKWDEIMLSNDKAEVHIVHVSDGKAVKILNESLYQNIQVTENGQFLTFDEIFPLRTSYERNKGLDFQTAYRDLKTLDSAKVIYPRNETRRNFTWSKSKMNYAWVDSGQVVIQKLGDEEARNLTKGKAFTDAEKKKEEKFTILSWSPQEGSILLSSEKGYWLADAAGDTLQLIYELPKEKEKAPKMDLVNWSQDERYLYFSVSKKEKWERGFARFDLETLQLENLILDSRLYTNVMHSKDGSKVVLNVSDGDLPANAVATDLNFGTFKQLTNLNPWIADKKITRSELITYRNVDGKELKGILYYPVDYEEGKSYPLVCEVYEDFFENGFNSRMNLVANEGYFGLRPSVDLEIGYPGEAWVKGITSAINKLVDEGKVDNKKVGVHGISYGGYATSLLITQTDRFAAAINISGKVNIISFLGDSPKIGTRNYSAAEVGQDRIGGSLWDDPLKYLATTAVLHADRVKTPHLLLTGEGDWNVPGGNTREMYYALRRLGKDVTWVNYLNAGHGAGFASDENDYHDQWRRMSEFYRKNFFKEESKDPAKGED